MYLTRRQKEILDFISEQIADLGYAPSIEEICLRFDLSSTATVHKHLSNLESKGLIRRSANRSRSIELCQPPPTEQRPHYAAQHHAEQGQTGPSNEPQAQGQSLARSAAVSVPLLGRIAAGHPIEALEVPESIDLPQDMLGRGETFVLEVAGDSMIDEQIRDGDYVIVERCASADDGQIVVALIGGEEATLKRFYREGGQVRLQPANVNMSPIMVREGEFNIQGVVIGVLRKY